MVSGTQPDLMAVDWSKIPAPIDDGAARHLVGAKFADLGLPSTDGGTVSIGALKGRTIVFAYPRTGTPGQISLVDDWDMIPGARGCTPQSCAFRDLFKEVTAAGAAHVFGLSTQDTAYQQELATRLHLPFPVLSDADLRLATSMRLPTRKAGGLTLIKRMAMVIDNSIVTHLFYPVFPPDQNAADVLTWLRANPV